MPTGCCHYPAHHDSPSAGAPIGLILAMIAGALIVTHWHTVVVVLTVVAVLAVITTAVVMLFHAHRSVPYDAAYSGDRRQDTPRQLQAGQSAPVTTQVVHVHATPAPDRTEALTAEIAALRAQLAAQQPPAIAPPAQHLHLYGVSAADVAELVTRHAPPALEERP
jgi:hypothetical protein